MITQGIHDREPGSQGAHTRAELFAKGGEYALLPHRPGEVARFGGDAGVSDPRRRQGLVAVQVQGAPGERAGPTLRVVRVLPPGVLEGARVVDRHTTNGVDDSAQAGEIDRDPVLDGEPGHLRDDGGLD